jgi:hypothetical protein
VATLRLATTAGRTSRISARAEGSKRTSQTSPLFGDGTIDMKVNLVEGLKVSQSKVAAVEFLSPIRLSPKDGRPFIRRKFPEFGRREPLAFGRDLEIVHGEAPSSRRHLSVVVSEILSDFFARRNPADGRGRYSAPAGPD